MTVWEVVKQSAVRRLGKPTLIGYGLLTLVALVGMTTTVLIELLTK